MVFLYKAEAQNPPEADVRGRRGRSRERERGERLEWEVGGGAGGERTHLARMSLNRSRPS